jgi:hypothetical protein
MDREPTRFIVEQIERLSTALGPLRIAVKWFQLHEHKFDPSPVR